MSTPDEEPDPRRWAALFTCVTALFITLLDVSIVLVALPSIGDGIGAGPSELQWVVSGYALFQRQSREAALWAMARTREAGAPVFVDPASYALIEDVGPQNFLRWIADAIGGCH